MKTKFQFILMVQRVRVASVLQVSVNRLLNQHLSLPVESSIFSAEMDAINMAFDIISFTADSSIVIFCDSY